MYLLEYRMAEIKLTYFPTTGRAEVSRLILAHAGVKYEDERISFDQFRAIKEDPSKEKPSINHIFQKISFLQGLYKLCLLIYCSFFSG